MSTGVVNYYAVLGVEATATADEIERAYRRLIRRWHPDLNPSPEAHTRTVRINQAREVLLDPDKRALHDRALGLHRTGPPPDARAGEAAGPSQTARTQMRAEQERQERARHQAEARARRAERARARAEAAARAREERTRAEAAARVRRAADATPLSWDDDRFVVGHRYASIAGSFEVIAVADGRARIRYANGLEMSVPVASLWDQWQTEGSARARHARRPWTPRPSAYAVERPGATAPVPAPRPTDRRPPPAAESAHAPTTSTDETIAVVRRIAGTATGEDIVRYLAHQGWGEVRDERDARGTLWFIPTVDYLAAFSRLAAELTHAQQAYRFRPGRTGATVGRPGWCVIDADPSESRGATRPAGRPRRR